MASDDTPFAARCLLRAARVGTLATQQDGQPFASLVTPAAAPDGSVLLLLSALSAHTRHLAAEPRCALLVCGAPEDPNPQTAPRLTVTGRAAPDPDPAWRAYWVARHPYAEPYAGFVDFQLWRVMPERGHYVGGFASAHGLGAADLLAPRPALDAVQGAATRILAHCNADHAHALGLLARERGQAGAWRMLGVDTDGFDLVQGDTVLRIPFDAPVADATGVRAALVRLVRRAGAPD